MNDDSRGEMAPASLDRLAGLLRSVAGPSKTAGGLEETRRDYLWSRVVRLVQATNDESMSDRRSR